MQQQTPLGITAVAGGDFQREDIDDLHPSMQAGLGLSGVVPAFSRVVDGDQKTIASRTRQMQASVSRLTGMDSSAPQWLAQKETPERSPRSSILSADPHHPAAPDKTSRIGLICATSFVPCGTA